MHIITVVIFVALTDTYNHSMSKCKNEEYTHCMPLQYQKHR